MVGVQTKFNYAWVSPAPNGPLATYPMEEDTVLSMEHTSFIIEHMRADSFFFWL